MEGTYLDERVISFGMIDDAVMSFGIREEAIMSLDIMEEAIVSFGMSDESIMFSMIDEGIMFSMIDEGIMFSMIDEGIMFSIVDESIMFGIVDESIMFGTVEESLTAAAEAISESATEMLLEVGTAIGFIPPEIIGAPLVIVGIDGSSDTLTEKAPNPAVAWPTISETIDESSLAVGQNQPLRHSMHWKPRPHAQDCRGILGCGGQ